MLKNELVEVRKHEPFTTSKLVADKLDVNHKDLLRTIEKIIVKKGADQHPVFSQKFIKTTFTNKMNKQYEWYLINEPWFIKLIMQLGRYKKADIIQNEFIEAFFKMKKALNNHENNSWIQDRERGKLVRHEETDVIKELIEYAEKEQGYPLKFPLYSTYTKMTNKHLQFIIDCKEWQPVRELASARDLWFIMIVDDRCKNAIIDGMNRKLPYREIYRYAKEEVNKLVQSLDFKPKTKLEFQK